MDQIAIDTPMKAVVYTKYGSPDVLEVKEIQKPTINEDQVLIEVRAASINPFDWHHLRGKPLFMRMMGAGLLKPKQKILGYDVAGRVEAVGRNVKQFQPGDEVFGASRFGALAEYVGATEDNLLLKPANISFEEAAAVPLAGLTALQGLRKGQIQPGQKVLINGASGGVGTFALQIAKSFGAEVTAVCSTKNVEIARSIGANQVIDYSQEDFTENGLRYDLILAANGYHSISEYMRALSSNGICVATGGSLAQIFQVILLGPFMSRLGTKKIDWLDAKLNMKDMVFLKELLEAGTLISVIDRRYPLSEAPEALRYLEEGHARGKVSITLGHDN